MSDFIKKVLFDLLQYRKLEETQEFSSLKHNKDLCPMVQSKVEDLLHSFKKYKSVAYDVQGFRDEGVDVVLRLCSEDEPNKYVCIQIKSNDDLKSDNYLTNLKAQTSDARNKYGNNMLDYYILVCCDLNSKKVKKSNSNKLRQINAAFVNVNDIHVIRPEYVLGFLKLSMVQINIILKYKLSEEDIVLQEAMNLVGDLTPTEKALLYFILYLRIFEGHNYFMIEDIVSDNFLSSIYSMVEDYERNWFFSDDESGNYYKYLNRSFKERINYDLEYLESSFITADTEVERYYLILDGVYSLVSLMVDGYVRYGYREEELLSYMTQLLPSSKISLQ